MPGPVLQVTPSRATATTWLRRSGSRVSPEVLAGSACTREFAEHAVQGAESDRQVTFTCFQMRRGTGKLGGKPLAVGERHRQIGVSVPDHDRHRDLLQPEAPRLGE